jgi:hypothetical protein
MVIPIAPSDDRELPAERRNPAAATWRRHKDHENASERPGETSGARIRTQDAEGIDDEDSASWCRSPCTPRTTTVATPQSNTPRRGRRRARRGRPEPGGGCRPVARSARPTRRDQPDDREADAPGDSARWRGAAEDDLEMISPTTPGERGCRRSAARVAAEGCCRREAQRPARPHPDPGWAVCRPPRSAHGRASQGATASGSASGSPRERPARAS